MLVGNNKPSCVNLYFICFYLFSLFITVSLVIFISIGFNCSKRSKSYKSKSDLLQINYPMALAFFFYQFELCTVHVFFCLLFVEMFRQFLLAAILVILLPCQHPKKIQLVFLKRQLAKDCFLHFLK